MDQHVGETGFMSEISISYSVKDILARVEGKLDATLIALATKAEHRDLIQLAERVHTLELAEEKRQEFSAQRTAWRRFITPTLISLIATLAVVLSVVHPF